MAREGTVSHLRLVVEPTKQAAVKPPAKRHEPSAQRSLFPEPSALLGLVDMSGARAGTFTALLEDVRPRWLMDLRAVPRFDMGVMNRKLFFNLFERLQIRYRDISGLAGITTRKDASLSSGAVASTLNTLLAEEPSSQGTGPLLLLMDDTARVAVAERVLPPLLEPKPRGGWQIQLFKTQ
ncbi:MAG TPA: hypothetical protein VFZ09_31570 [Archangium sp.]|uniref:hypothetical protein n=1 Tax=Archangium sp. TaxID=1872627 RepID=UPI002E3824A3|nr:hypothetical protein [Archangium sp.]HEX5750806.1 hypothetical protein [Archangium sp.]